jgi:GNAT superfamily N-acetyltransferase
MRLFAGLDDLLERNERTWWGGVVTDARIPLIYDANYARVEVGDVSLAEIDEVLRPALLRARATHQHVVVFRPDAAKPLLDELEAAGGRFTYDTAMRFEADASIEPELEVREVDELDTAFWEAQRRTLPAFDVVDPPTIEQFLRWEREIMAPAGKRWFAVTMDGETAGFGALVTHRGVGYVDNVVTFPSFRRRGVASSIVRRIEREAVEGGCSDLFLLADEPDPIRLYERLGFGRAGQVVGWVKALT